jgi:hypothetical protein
MTEQTPQTEEERLAEEGIQALLSPQVGEAIADAADAQYLSFAPLLGAEGHQRGQQLGRVAYEFIVGAPTKFLTYWRQGWSCLVDHPEDHKVWGNVALMVVGPIMGLLALPLGFGYFLRAVWTALSEGVIKRQVTFIPKAEHRARLTRKQ